jgi:hypothetical protein
VLGPYNRPCGTDGRRSFHWWLILIKAIGTFTIPKGENRLLIVQ